jgi:hypothetical protein
MGHIRLGSIPKTRQWGAVVSMMGSSDIASGGSPISAHVPMIAQKSLEAAQNGLKQAKDDVGLAFSFYLLTRTILASRKKNWRAELENLGIPLSSGETVFDLVSEVQASVEDHLYAQDARFTDVTEMGLSAVSEALTNLVAPDTETLFGDEAHDLRAALRKHSTKKGISVKCFLVASCHAT